MTKIPDIDEEALNYGEGKKEIIFRESFKRHADLKIQLQYDGLNMAKFLRQCVTFYLEKNVLMMELIDQMKKSSRVSVDKIKIAKQERKESAQVTSDFALNDNEIENIFDMLEEEYPEL